MKLTALILLFYFHRFQLFVTFTFCYFLMFITFTIFTTTYFNFKILFCTSFSYKHILIILTIVETCHGSSLWSRMCTLWFRYKFSHATYFQLKRRQFILRWFLTQIFMTKLHWYCGLIELILPRTILTSQMSQKRGKLLLQLHRFCDGFVPIRKWRKTDIYLLRFWIRFNRANAKHRKNQCNIFDTILTHKKQC